MPNVIIYTTGYCPYCYQAKDLLDNKNIQYQEIRIDSDPARRAEMIQKSQRRTVPQIFINGHHVGVVMICMLLNVKGVWINF